jgi:protein SCO1/2
MRASSRRPLRILAAPLILAALLAAAPLPLRAGESRLIDQDGHGVDASELGGHWLLVYFGYAGCREICPGALTTMGAVLNRLGPAGDAVEPVFVTLDPEHDSPAVLKAFAARFHPRLRALTGTAAAVADAAHTFEVAWRRASATDIDHGMMLYLVAPDGRVAQVLHPQQSVVDLAAAIAKHLAMPPAT